MLGVEIKKTYTKNYLTQQHTNNTPELLWRKSQSRKHCNKEALFYYSP
jgi:hypothetical protein